MKTMNQKRVSVVIGAGFGDEGKGITTARLVHFIKSRQCPTYLRPAQRDVVVVRYNGGAQASHTVVANGFRHAFSHFGAGTLSAASTHLSNDFIVNVDLFFRERHILKTAGYHPIVTLDPRAKITLPIDIIINQVAELNREARHGSCGLGINETVTRYERWNDAERTHAALHRCTSIVDDGNADEDRIAGDTEREVFGTTLNPKSFKTSTMYQWFLTRLEQLGLTERRVLDTLQITSFDTCVEFIASVMRVWLSRWIEFNCFVTVQTLGGNLCLHRAQRAHYSDRDSTLIFEGAQGLELDEVNGIFPHVTRSRTGSTNIISALKELSEVAQRPIEVDLHYVSRIYKTRHGAGPLEHEKTIQEMFDLGYNIRDLTNVPNEFQGTLRYGLLDVDALHARIEQDLQLWNNSGFSVGTKTLEITCADQATDPQAVAYVQGHRERTTTLETFASDALAQFVSDGFMINFHSSPALDGD